MRNARPAARPHLAIALVFLLGGLNGSLSAAPAAPPASASPLPASSETVIPLTGKIEHITILGNKNISADTIRTDLTSKVGDPYTSQATDKDAATLNGMGVFQKTDVTATAVPGGVDLTYTLTENPIIKSIRFIADTPIFNADATTSTTDASPKQPVIPAAMLLAQMRTQVGHMFNTKVLKGDLDALLNHDTGYVRKQGYLFDLSATIFDARTAALTILLVQDRIQSIQITGNTRVKTADILVQMHTKPGDLYDDTVLQKDTSAIYEMGAFTEVQNWTFTEPTPGRIIVAMPVVEREAGTVDKLDEKRGKVVPFLYDPVTVPCPVIQVSIDGKPPLPFFLDTGSTPAISLDLWAAARLGFKKQTSMEKGEGFNFRKVAIQGVVLQGADHGNDVPLQVHEAFVLDLGVISANNIGQRIAGIIGLGMLGPFTSRFNFKAKTLTVFSYSHPPLRLPGATVLPLRLTPSQLFTVHVAMTPDVAAALILDTGSASTQVPLADLGALHPTATAYSGESVMIGALYVCPALRLPSLTLGKLRVPDVVVGTLPLETTSLGMDILAGYRLTLDGPNGQLSLEPLAAGGRYVQGWSGLDLKQTGEGWSVSELKANSPARRAGALVGDEVLRVNGQNVQGLSRIQVGLLTSGLSGRSQTVSLRRGGDRATPGTTSNVSWVPLDTFSAPRAALDGLTMKKPNGSPWVILDVLRGCPGDLAGLQVGDEITRMNGALVADMPLDQLLKIMDGASKSIALTVTRTGRTEPLSVKLVAPPQKVAP